MTLWPPSRPWRGRRRWNVQRAVRRAAAGDGHARRARGAEAVEARDRDARDVGRALEEDPVARARARSRRAGRRRASRRAGCAPAATASPMKSAATSSSVCGDGVRRSCVVRLAPGTRESFVGATRRGGRTGSASARMATAAGRRRTRSPRPCRRSTGRCRGPSGRCAGSRRPGARDLRRRRPGRPRAACAGRPGPRARASGPAAAGRVGAGAGDATGQPTHSGISSPRSATLRSNGRTVPGRARRPRPSPRARASTGRRCGPTGRASPRSASSANSASLSPLLAACRPLISLSPSARAARRSSGVRSPCSALWTELGSSARRVGFEVARRARSAAWSRSLIEQRDVRPCAVDHACRSAGACASRATSRASSPRRDRRDAPAVAVGAQLGAATRPGRGEASSDGTGRARPGGTTESRIEAVDVARVAGGVLPRRPSSRTRRRRSSSLS